MNASAPPATPTLVLLGGSLRPASTSNEVLGWCAGRCRARGAKVTTFLGGDLEFPFYRSDGPHTGPVRSFLAALTDADGVVVVSPAYHGAVSGLVKNALDYLNDLRDPRRPYLDGRPMGCVAVCLGPQGGTSTLVTLRTIAHALRAWPTPLGVTVTDTVTVTDSVGVGVGMAPAPADPLDERTRTALSTMLDQVLVLAAANARDRPVAVDHPM